MSAPVTEKLSVCVQQFSGAEDPTRAYEQGGQKLSCFDLNNRLPALKEEHPWLKEVNSRSLWSVNKNPANAFTRFFQEKKGLPRFDSKKNPVQSFQIPQRQISADWRS